jgi:hypothetical protein
MRRYSGLLVLLLLLYQGVGLSQNRSQNFDPSDRKTFGARLNGSGNLEAVVCNIGKDTVALRRYTSDGEVLARDDYHLVDELLNGNIRKDVDDNYSYAIADLQVGDVVHVIYITHNNQRFIKLMEISRRPSGDIPQSRNPPRDRPGFAQRRNIHDRYYYNQERVPEEELRANHMILEAVILYGKKEGDDKLLENRRIYNDDDLELAMCRNAKRIDDLCSVEKDRIEKLKAVEEKEAKEAKLKAPKIEVKK